MIQYAIDITEIKDSDENNSNIMSKEIGGDANFFLLMWSLSSEW